jgi:hypothetical protein
MHFHTNKQFYVREQLYEAIVVKHARLLCIHASASFSVLSSPVHVCEMHLIYLRSCYFVVIRVSELRHVCVSSSSVS